MINIQDEKGSSSFNMLLLCRIHTFYLKVQKSFFIHREDNLYRQIFF